MSVRSSVELPCSVGDVVYHIVGSQEIQELRVTRMKAFFEEVKGKQVTAYVIYARLPRSSADILLTGTFFNDTWFTEKPLLGKSKQKSKHKNRNNSNSINKEGESKDVTKV